MSRCRNKVLKMNNAHRFCFEQEMHTVRCETNRVHGFSTLWYLRKPKSDWNPFSPFETSLDLLANIKNLKINSIKESIIQSINQSIKDKHLWKESLLLKDVFLTFYKDIFCGCSKEPPQWDSSFEYQKHMFLYAFERIHHPVGCPVEITKMFTECFEITPI